STTYSYAGEGVQYPYWKAGNSKAKYQNGSTCWWVERSPSITGSSCFAVVNSSGYSNEITADSSNGVSFGFCV
ncbi:MAG: hypothetical protein RR739_11500, partial [Clostridia bacterium]